MESAVEWIRLTLETKFIIMMTMIIHGLLDHVWWHHVILIHCNSLCFSPFSFISFVSSTMISFLYSFYNFISSVYYLPFLSICVLIMMYDLKSQPASISSATCRLHWNITVHLKINNKMLLLLLIWNSCIWTADWNNFNVNDPSSYEHYLRSGERKA